MHVNKTGTGDKAIAGNSVWGKSTQRERECDPEWQRHQTRYAITRAHKSARVVNSAVGHIVKGRKIWQRHEACRQLEKATCGIHDTCIGSHEPPNGRK
jgi:hypothetical protein